MVFHGFSFCLVNARAHAAERERETRLVRAHRSESPQRLFPSSPSVFEQDKHLPPLTEFDIFEMVHEHAVIAFHLLHALSQTVLVRWLH